MRIAVVVHGRFHAFDLARALLDRGHDVVLFTNYPRRVVGSFGFPPARVRSCLWHGVALRALDLLNRATRRTWGERWLHQAFGRWAARRLRAERWDVVHVWSGVAEEVLRSMAGTGTHTWLMRGSAHIRTQTTLLEEEERRAGEAVERPSPWMVQREEREYELADQVRVLSSFARDTFLANGMPADRMVMIPLAAGAAFRATPAQAQQRCARIRSGAPLRLLFVGTLSPRKGTVDLRKVLEQLDPDRFVARIVAATSHRELDRFGRVGSNVSVERRVPQSRLPEVYAWGDLFLFPTIEDGFAVVVAQALASALPILATTNCGARDLVDEGRTGWILPIRTPAAFVERIRWADRHREELAAMVERLQQGYRERTWAQVAADFDSVSAP